jgi:4-aminobutyrate aminotransferase-like enzyme
MGHCYPKVVAAIKDQADKFIHPCFHVAAYEPHIELAARLKSSKIVPESRNCFCCLGRGSVLTLNALRHMYICL